MEKLRKARKSKGYSQEKMAELLNMPTVTYGNYERGQSKPNAELLLKISKVLNVSIDWLLDNTAQEIVFSPEEKETIRKAMIIIKEKIFS